MTHSDRLVELFVQSSRGDGNIGGVGGWDGRPMDEEAIERGIETMEKMLSTEDAIRMGGTPTATFVCLAMALEEKPKLGPGAVRCYEKALEHMPAREGKGGNWERIVVLQQLGAVCLRQRRLAEAQRWLGECAGACTKVAGHPRDAVLFGGTFNTKQTRSEFLSMVEKMRAKTCMELGDQAAARAHVAEAQRVEAAATGDAVERHAAETGGGSGGGARVAAAEPARDVVKELWAAEPKEEKRLKEYSYTDEGPTVLVILDLNEHLGIGPEASTAVDSLRQFRVECQDFAVDVRLRLRRADGSVCEFRLLLSPLAREIVPEDTVPRLRGREGKRRLEIKLFKRDQKESWFGDLVAEGPTQKQLHAEVAKSKQGSAVKAEAKPVEKAEKGTLLNPLTAEELARLPRPSGGASADNRPSTWRQTEPTPVERLRSRPSSL